jgi:hypothetical protein
MLITKNRKLKTENGTIPQDDRPREQCGIFGLFGHPEAARSTFLGLYALQYQAKNPAALPPVTVFGV